MTTYIKTHGVPGTPRTFQADLELPIPASGVSGSLRLSRTAPHRAGDKITVITGGQRYTYYATTTTDVSTASNAVPVLPVIQTTHAVGDDVEYPYPDYAKSVGMNAIVSVDCNSADVTPAYARRLVMPFITDWPYATDSFGLSWDQSNILALYLNPISTTGVQEIPTPVPRAIGSEYTKFSARSLGKTAGYYAPGIASLYQYRSATGAWPSAALTRRWVPLPQVNSYYPAEPDESVYLGRKIPTEGDGWEDINSASWVVLQTSTGGSFAVGARGGGYSFCGFCFDPDTGTNYTFTVQVRAIMPGLGDILLHSFVVPAGGAYPNYLGTVVSGTWAGVVIPTDLSGTGASFYLRAINGGGGVNTYAYMTYGSNVCIAASTQVPWQHHIVTGNLHAPGGLIAPFY